MATLTKAWEQAKDLFASMTPGARITAVLLLAVIVISLGYLFTMSGDSSGEYLLAGRDFSGNEMARIQSALGSAGLNGAKIEGTKIKVPAGEEAKYLAAMAKEGALPRDFAEIMADAMTDISPFASRDQRQEAIKNAKMAALSQIIQFMDEGIEGVQVVYDESTSRGIRGGSTKTAAVTLQTSNRHATIDPNLAQAIRNNVAASYAGLDKKNVNITANNMPVANPADLSDPALEGQQKFFLAKKQLEQFYTAKIRSSFPVPGIIVSSEVTLDPTLLNRESSRTLSDKSGGTLSDSITEQSTTSETNPAGGRPPAQATANANAQVSLAGTASGTSDETNQSTSEKTTIPGHTDKVKETAPLTPTSVSVAIGVPDTFFIERWKLDNPDEDREPTTTDWKPLEDAAFLDWKEHVMGQISTPETAPNAAVTFTTFTTLPSPEVPEEGFSDSAMGWIARNGGTFGMVFLGLIGLMMVRSFVKSATNQPEAKEVASETAEAPEQNTDEPDAPKAARKWDAAEGDVTQELAELVREDPDTAASILQGWITTPT